MEVDRRAALRLIAGAGAAAAFSALELNRAPRARGTTLGLRSVAPTDAPHVRAMMNACVTGDGAFHGKCGEWSAAWSTHLIERRPKSVVITFGDLPVAFLELPTIRPALAPLALDASDAERASYAVRRKNRVTFELSAAGIRTDVLSPADAVAMFRRVLYYGFRAARAQGFEYGEGYFPWEQHPSMPRKWTDYPGCALVETPSRSAVDGRTVFWLRWNLDDAIEALALEGAAAEALDVD